MIIVLVTLQPLIHSMLSLVMQCSVINLAVSPNHIITVHNSDHVAAHVRTSSKPLSATVRDPRPTEGTVSLVQHTALQIAVLVVYLFVCN